MAKNAYCRIFYSFKKIWSIKHKGIEYRIGCLPFGGYVDIPQLDSTGETKDKDGKALPRVSPINRIIVAFAGPLFNVLFGLFLAFSLDIRNSSKHSKNEDYNSSSIKKESPEYKAGLRKGDNIVQINGKRFYASWNKVQQDIVFTIGKVKLGIEQKNSYHQNISYKPAVNPNSPLAKKVFPVLFLFRNTYHYSYKI